jgi:hypothetical protein
VHGQQLRWQCWPWRSNCFSCVRLCGLELVKIIALPAAGIAVLLAVL